MNKKLPPLNWLRSFEASAKHLNFTHAAQELNLTQAAISKQIRNLEYSLGTNLFVRLPRGLELSEDGAAYLPAVKESIEKLAAATNELFGTGHSQVLNVRSSLVFFNCWLVQRLSDFYLKNSPVDLRFTSDVWVNDGDIDPGVDMEIRYGRGEWPNLIAERLTHDQLVPVCSPELLRDKPIKSKSDLNQHTLLHVLGYQDGWGHWLSSMGLTSINANRGMQFDTLISAFSAARHGMGVALGRSSLVQDLIMQGKLVMPLTESLETQEAFYLVYRPGQCDTGVSKYFRDWLVGQAKLK
jgi:LysR family glycine cleavage system transcriptional activator